MGHDPEDYQHRVGDEPTDLKNFLIAQAMFDSKQYRLPLLKPPKNLIKQRPTGT